MPQQTAQLSRDLLDVIHGDGAKLGEFSEADAAGRPGGGAGWSRKEELGHLVDSAANNRARFINAALSGSYAGASYDGDGWVRLGGYRDTEWATLQSLWMVQNEALATLIAHLPEDSLTVKCQVGGGPEVTLGFLIEDYILHMQHHLDHLLGREASTAYPGANMGV